ncbi:MAG TPA: branched-chain amino acid ABC transporter permease [Rhodocyclaceae bacterium]|nr:branched-chain amino acid ABC transporter permease [Rhodocyclaceae bacterium]
MDKTIFLFLVQDGVINGSIYALAAIALVLVFTVTRVILVPQGEFISFGAMTVAALEAGHMPPTAWLLVALGVLSAAAALVQQRRTLSVRGVTLIVLFNLVLPALLAALTYTLAPLKLGTAMNILLAVALIVPMGPMLYRVAFAPLANASVLVLLIAAFGVHFSLMGLGLVFFGPEGISTQPLLTQSFTAGGIPITGQSVSVVAATALLLIVFALFFGRTLIGKALRACASNRLGARLVGIPTAIAGQTSFALAACLGAVSGVLAGPIVTIYYDSGFLIGLKAFVAAILGGLVSFPLTVLASLGVGIAESFFSFWTSNFKEVMVFSLILPVLLWRSLRAPAQAEEE